MLSGRRGTVALEHAIQGGIVNKKTYMIAILCICLFAGVGILSGCQKVKSTTAASTSTSAGVAKPSWSDQLITPGGTTVVIGADTNYPPFESAPKSGDEFVGFDVDLMKAIGEKTGLDFKFKTYNFDSLVAGLNGGTDFDMVTSAWTINAERQKQVDFSIPYYRNDFGVVVPKDSKLTSYKQLEKGDIVSVQTGSSAHEWAKKQFAGTGVQIKTFENTLDCFNALTAGDADMVIQDLAMSASVVSDTARNAKIVEHVSVAEYFGMGFAKNAKGAAMKTTVDATLKELAADGTYSRIYKKWFGVEPTFVPGDPTE